MTTTRAPGNYLDELLAIRHLMVDGQKLRFARDLNFDSETMQVDVETTTDATTGLPIGRVTLGVRPDAVAAMSAWKNSAHYVATVDITNFLSTSINTANWDGQTPALNDRVLVGPYQVTVEEDQSGAIERGLYVITSLADGVKLERAEDFDSASDAVLGARIPVLRGDLYAGSTWQLTSPTSGTVTPGTTPLVFRRIDGPEHIAFSKWLTLDRNVKMVHDGDGSADLELNIDTDAEPRDGVMGELICPPGSVLTGFDRVASNLRPQNWETLDPAKPFEITWFVSIVDGERLLGSTGRILDSEDVTPPTLVSATVYGADPDKLVLVFSGKATAKGVTNLALTGTAATITAIVSGLGTTTVVLDLSADLTGSETVSIEFEEGHTFQDPNGPPVADGVHSVALEFDWAMPDMTHLWRGDQITATGSDVDTVVDQVGSDDMVASATNPTVTTIGTLAAPGWTNINNSYLSVDVATENMVEGAIFVVVDLAATGTQGIVSAGLDGAETTSELSIFTLAGTSLRGRHKVAGTNDLDAAFTSTVLVDILFTWDGTDSQLYVDGAQVDTDPIGTAAGSIERWAIGVFADLANGTAAVGAKFGEARVGTSKLTSGDATDAHNYRLARYGT